MNDALQEALAPFWVVFASQCNSQGLAQNAAALEELGEIGLARLAGPAIITIRHAFVRNPRIKEITDALLCAEISYLKPLLIAVVERKDNEHILDEVYAALALHLRAISGGVATAPPTDASLAPPTARTPAEQAFLSSAPPDPTPAEQALVYRSSTPVGFGSSSMINSSGQIQYAQLLLEQEVGGTTLRDLENFIELLIPAPAGADTAVANLLQEFIQGGVYLQDERMWANWKDDAQEQDVSRILLDLSLKTQRFLQSLSDPSFSPRWSISKCVSPSKPLVNGDEQHDPSKRKVDAAFVASSLTETPRWGQVIVPIELKSNKTFDTIKAQLSLSRYALKIFNNQAQRSSVLGLTICGNLLRIFQYDRLGAVASTPIDIHKQPESFLQVFLRIHCMPPETLGFDTSFLRVDLGQYFVKVPDEPRRFFIDKLLVPPSGIVCRATTIWTGHFEGNPTTSYVLKQSWQHPQRCEGHLLEHAIV